MVVISIIAVLMTILLPTLSGARRQARVTVGMANLRSCAQIMIVYTNDSMEEFLNPFRDRVAAGENHVFTDAVASSDASLKWDFSASNAVWNTELFGYYWYSYLAEWAGRGRVSDEMFSPADAALTGQSRDMRGHVETMDKLMLWPSSFVYSPTFWSDSERYPAGSPERLGMSTLFLRTAAAGSINRPAAKVLVFERADFGQVRRIAGTQTQGTTDSNNAPAWNNPRATTTLALADGSVDQAGMSRLGSRAASDRSGELVPCGLAGVSDGLPLWAPKGRQSEFPTGGLPSSADNTYPLYFWATRFGVRGRDLDR